MTTQRTSQAVAAVAMTALLAAGVGPAEVVGATALTLGAGLLSGGFGIPRAFAARRRGASRGAGRIPQPR